MTERLAALSGWMKDNNVDVTFVTSPDNVFYLSGFLSDPHERLLAVAVFPDAEPFMICPAMDKENAKNAGWDMEIIGYSDTDDSMELAYNAIKKRVSSVKKTAIEKEQLNVERYEKMAGLFGGSEFVSAEEKLRIMRMVKSEEELQKLRVACELADFAIQTGVNEIQEGKTELDVLAAIEYELKKKGVTEMSFSTMVLTGKNAAAPHGTPGLTKIKKGDLVLFDLGVVMDGYCSDITRTVAYGEINKQQEEIYHTVLKAQLTALDTARAGIACSEVDLAARRVIEEAGYGDYFPHRLGHGLGVSVHEYPSLTSTNPLLMEKGMVFTAEPGIYVPGVAGVRIEDDVVITEDGIEILTKFPKELVFVS
ncbi:Xaa-Pro peptidase family protein [Mesobacillus subterraneus]|uniref:M24 family metallopeptidase n=1 Tax=Mesobacillus subterraneus TaxID=285983 RepID=UPI001CFC78EF|nr:Xaa-Pro peptidase family protein [Mesobacillus subterraneus]WLR56081.1 Xaa-Pro peptidase family protein [Mesobacillus subterraneus]